MSMLGTLVWRGFSYAYGFFCLSLVTGTAAFKDGAWSRKGKLSEEEEKEFAIARKKYWDLSTEPLPGFRHAFYTLRNGTKLHYVVNDASGSVRGRDVVIFIHGFPDSYLLWRQLLNSPSLSSSTLVAVDLPGYGGSDSVDKYDPEHVLEAMTSFILGMRELYLAEDAKLVMVTHDWGSIIGARLASQAKELAHRWILVAGIIPEHLRSNADTLAASSKQMLRTYFHHPTRFCLIKNAVATLSPVIKQVQLSFYIFIINLPFPVAKWAMTMGNFWFLRLCHRGHLRSKTPTATAIAEAHAISCGPGPEQLQDSDMQYPASVQARVPDHGMSQKMRLYREGLLSQPWEKSLETIAALAQIPVEPTRSGSGAGLFEEGPPGALKAPATIIHGRHDFAFERRLVLNGLGDYLTRKSQVLVLEKSGHWMPTEEFAVKVIADVAEWALNGEKTSLREKLAGVKDVTILVDKK